MRTRTLIAFVLSAPLLAPGASAQAGLEPDVIKSGSAGFQFLKIGTGAREVGLGEAAAAMSNDASAVFWNVGALGRIDGPQATFTHNKWLVDSEVNAVSVAAPVGPYAVGISVASFGIQPFEETTILAPDGTGRFVDAGDFLVGLSAARRFTDRLSIGVQAKYVRETLDLDAYSNVLFDIGALYYTGFRDLRLAFALQHFGPDVKGLDQDFRTPLLFRVGVADELFKRETVRLSASAELVHPTDTREWYQAGAEAVVFDALAARAGYRIGSDEGSFSFGGGVLSPTISGVRVKADYAYTPFGTELGPVHRVTIGLGL